MCHGGSYSHKLIGFPEKLFFHVPPNNALICCPSHFFQSFNVSCESNRTKTNVRVSPQPAQESFYTPQTLQTSCRRCGCVGVSMHTAEERGKHGLKVCFIHTHTHPCTFLNMRTFLEIIHYLTLTVLTNPVTLTLNLHPILNSCEDQPTWPHFTKASLLVEWGC